MPHKLKVRRGYTTLEAVNPGDGKPCEVFLTNEKMDHVANRSRGQALELAYHCTVYTQTADGDI